MDLIISFSNQKCMIQPTLINLHPNEYRQEFYPFAVKLDRYPGSFNILNDLSNEACVVLNKTTFKSKLVQRDYRNKRTENINKVYIMQVQL